MNFRMTQLRRTSPRESIKLEEMKWIYSTRDDKIQLLKKLTSNRLKSCEKSIAKKKIKISIQIPRFETDYSDEELKSTSPIRANATSASRPKRIIFKSSFEKIYGLRNRILIPYKKLSYGIF